MVKIASKAIIIAQMRVSACVCQKKVVPLSAVWRDIALPGCSNSFKGFKGSNRITELRVKRNAKGN